jgi:hypothetical protein
MASIKSNVEQINDQQLLLDQSDANNIYLAVGKIGLATSATGWQIRRISNTGAILAIQYAGGSAAFDKVWNNRASYSYS